MNTRCPSCELLTMLRMHDATGRCQNCGRTIGTAAMADALEMAEMGRKPTPRKFPPVIYYIRWGDRIKIGTSENVRQRLHNLYHDEVLALEPGGRTLERRRHAQFADYKLPKYKEWFTVAPALIELTDTLRGQYPQLLKDL